MPRIWMSLTFCRLVKGLTLYSIDTHFTTSTTAFENIVEKKKKLLIMSNFFFSNNICIQSGNCIPVCQYLRNHVFICCWIGRTQIGMWGGKGLIKWLYVILDIKKWKTAFWKLFQVWSQWFQTLFASRMTNMVGNLLSLFPSISKRAWRTWPIMTGKKSKQVPSCFFSKREVPRFSAVRSDLSVINWY